MFRRTGNSAYGLEQNEKIKKSDSISKIVCLLSNATINGVYIFKLL